MEQIHVLGNPVFSPGLAFKKYFACESINCTFLVECIILRAVSSMRKKKTVRWRGGLGGAVRVLGMPGRLVYSLWECLVSPQAAVAKMVAAGHSDGRRPRNIGSSYE